MKLNCIKAYPHVDYSEIEHGEMYYNPHGVPAQDGLWVTAISRPHVSKSWEIVDITTEEVCSRKGIFPTNIRSGTFYVDMGGIDGRVILYHDDSRIHVKGFEKHQ